MAIYDANFDFEDDHPEVNLADGVIVPNPVTPMM